MFKTREKKTMNKLFTNRPRLIVFELYIFPIIRIDRKEQLYKK